MKRTSVAAFTLTVLALILAPLVLRAQEIAGTWQGTLEAGRPLRVVFKIEGAEGSLRGAMYSIDQSGQGVPMNPIAVQGSTVRFSVPGIGGAFEGRFAPDGASITGTWNQGGGGRPLILARATPDTAWAIPAPPPPMKPMAPDAVAQFEVATIKPSQPRGPGKAFMLRGRQFSTLNTSLSDLIGFAYGIHARQITNAPDWLESEKYDIVGRPEGEGQPSQSQWNEMFRKLMAERFQLAFHRDRKELPVYAIRVGRDGHKLTKTEAQGDTPALFFRRPGDLPARNATMRDFAGVLQAAVMDRPVIDQTGIEGRYDFTLRWTPDQFQFGGLGANLPPPPDNADLPNLYEAFQQQLGLRLETDRAPAEVFVIDKVEKPTPD
jgi:uncharacterized protein (TIGR03435 family)